jgi:pimeloyl-ACP methyl ester carboxylesterase
MNEITEAQVQTIPGFDGAALALHRLGSGRPLLLVHGLFSNAEVNWLRYGTAARLAAAGFEVLMPDLRAHGLSAAPHDPAAYPPDVLVADLLAVTAALGLGDGEYDLGGFSLGSRTVIGGVASGMPAPGRLILGGMGLEGLVGWSHRSDFFIDVIDRFGTIPREDPAWFAQNFLKSTGVDRIAVRLLLAALADTPPDDLAAITMPTLVLCGEDDRDNGSPEALAAALPDARHVAIPGTHMNCVTRREFGEAMAAFLAP